MKRIAIVRFRNEGKPCCFDAGDLTLRKNDLVVVEKDQGLSVGEVAADIRETEEANLPERPKRVVRLVSEEDLDTLAENGRLEQEAFAFCTSRIQARGLAMKLIEVQCLFDRSQIIFHFYAENRVDFRELVRDLVQKFRTRIELRQIGARQETRMIRGFGVCGREVCCALFLQNLDRVTIKMAKEQNLSLNPEKISGLCGRLMCCLAYEYDAYCLLKKGMTKCGKSIQTPEGRAKVIRQNVLKGEMVALREDGKEIAIRVPAPETAS